MLLEQVRASYRVGCELEQPVAQAKCFEEPKVLNPYTTGRSCHAPIAWGGVDGLDGRHRVSDGRPVPDERAVEKPSLVAREVLASLYDSTGHTSASSISN